MSLQSLSNNLIIIKDQNARISQHNGSTNHGANHCIAGAVQTVSSSSKQQSLSSNHGKPGYTRNLLVAILQAEMGAFLYGYNVGVLNVPQSVIQIDETGMKNTEWAMLNSMFCAGGMVGALAAGPLQHRFGRKVTLLLMYLFYALSAVTTFLYGYNLLGVDTHRKSGYPLFWSGRFIVGIASGLALGVVPTYLAEIAPPQIRGAIGTSNQLLLNLGTVLSNVVGYHLIMGGHTTWPTLFLPNAIPLLQLLTAFTFPESPKWLMQQERFDDARKALQRLRMSNDVKISIDTIPTTKNKNADIPLEENLIAGSPCTVDVITDNASTELSESRQAAKRAMAITIVLMVMQKFSGINAILYYSQFILKDAGITSEIGTWLGTTAISAANFFGVFIAIGLIDKSGRRFLLLSSGIAVVIASIGVSIAIYQSDSEEDSVLWGYVSLGFLILFVVGFEIGFGPVVWLLVGELPPMRYRGTIVSVATLMNWSSQLLVAQFSPITIESEFKMFPFAAASLIGTLFVMRYLPETNGKTATQIQKALAYT